MNSRELNLKLIKTFPELTNKYKAEISWQEGDDTGSHVVYGDVLIPFIKKAIQDKNELILKRVFEFLELLLLSKDEYVIEVVYFSVIESLIYDEEIQLDTYIHLVGKQTLFAIKELLNSNSY